MHNVNSATPITTMPQALPIAPAIQPTGLADYPLEIARDTAASGSGFLANLRNYFREMTDADAAVQVFTLMDFLEVRAVGNLNDTVRPLVSILEDALPQLTPRAINARESALNAADGPLMGGLRLIWGWLPLSPEREPGERFNAHVTCLTERAAKAAIQRSGLAATICMKPQERDDLVKTVASSEVFRQCILDIAHSFINIWTLNTLCKCVFAKNSIQLGLRNALDMQFGMAWPGPRATALDLPPQLCGIFAGPITDTQLDGAFRALARELEQHEQTHFGQPSRDALISRFIQLVCNGYTADLGDQPPPAINADVLDAFIASIAPFLPDRIDAALTRQALLVNVMAALPEHRDAIRHGLELGMVPANRWRGPPFPAQEADCSLQ
ncbi:hypothetical protein FNU76_11760 [Chitinimonas arctica]|uniref:Uncharacterized protein n=1 Tax=Chitinimonas arctica TaxID=2594795 RepID=A0A516SFQ5_9NEIS|nr:hypothetical protein [Chitinimonas arctica]QDQ26983.1 hypothetical protein FNU76_11760 [Chitinimonas arctica]